MIRLLVSLPAFALLVALIGLAEAQKKAPPAKGSPEESLGSVQVEKGLNVEVWAAEPLMQNPVSFCFDEKGAVYVAETNRLHTGTPDTRNFMKWLDEDLACRTVADRVAMYKKHGYGGFEKNDDIVRKVWDSTGSGKADKSSVFSSGYNQPQDGLGAGVLARKGSVYYTNIPDLYLLKDTKGENKADEKKSLFTGFGLSVQFVGHDLHGLRMGPDGKLYFTIGDRGFNVKTKEGKQLTYPNQGAVLRCDPDGANLEVVHAGLRNPQELAFDDFGNLFTYDNNCDSGDRARWVQIVEGGDSGWRGGYQYGTLYHPPGVPQGNRGPWNAEKIWHVPGPDGGPPAYVNPPLLHFGNGPSGITHYPGIGLNDKYKNHFFACDFTSSPGNSVIWDVSMKPKGASFELNPPVPFVRGIVPTDCEFGPDGAFYWSDWIAGWGHPNKGRIFKLTDPEAMKNPAVAEAKKLLAEGMDKRGVDELEKLLEHPHQMVRQEAQFELVNLKADGRLVRTAKNSGSRLARLHAIWGLGMLAKQYPQMLETLTELLTDEDSEVRAQTLRAIAFLPTVPGQLWLPLNKRLQGELDKEPRVQYFTALAYGKVEPPHPDHPQFRDLGHLSSLFQLLKSNDDSDAYIRHAAVVALARAAQDRGSIYDLWNGLKERYKYDTPSVRLGVVLALRRHKSEKVGEFLKDSDPKVAAEAAMAVYDERIAGAMPKLAAIAELSGQANPIIYRAIAANYTLGSKENAERVAKVAARSDQPDHVRIFAMKLLADWANPPRRDPITGLIHDLPKREASIATDVIRPVIAGMFSGSDAVRNEAAQTSAKLGIKEVGPLLTKIVKDLKETDENRTDALLALAGLKDPGLADTVEFARNTFGPKLRVAGLVLWSRANPDTAAVFKVLLGEIIGAFDATDTILRGVYQIFGEMKESAEVDKFLEDELVRIINDKVRGEVILDILEAAEKRIATPKLKLHAPLKDKLDEYRKARAKSPDKLAPWAETLAGGDAEKGRNHFLNNSAVYCQRCHKLDGQGGDVGPALNGLASQMGKDRRYFLESIVLPSATIAKGFETAVLTLTDGRVVSGVVKEDNKKQIKILTAEAKELIIAAEDIESRRTGPSAMPDDLHKKLTKRELRDLVEFLVSLRTPRR